MASSHKRKYEEVRKHRKTDLAIESDIRNYALNMLKAQALTPECFLNTYINILSKDILFTYLYSYINFDMIHYNRKILCPCCMKYNYSYGGSCLGHKIHSNNQLVCQYHICKHCSLVFICLILSDYSIISPCLYVLYTSVPELDESQIINSYYIDITKIKHLHKRGVKFHVIYNGELITIEFDFLLYHKMDLEHYELCLFKFRSLTPYHLSNTYINVLPKDILFNNLYSYINFDIAHNGKAITCPHCVTRKYIYSSVRYAYIVHHNKLFDFEYHYCEKCGSVFMCLMSSDKSLISSCLYIREIFFLKLDSSKIINSYYINSTVLPVTCLFRHEVKVKVIYNGNILMISI